MPGRHRRYSRPVKAAIIGAGALLAIEGLEAAGVLHPTAVQDNGLDTLTACAVIVTGLRVAAGEYMTRGSDRVGALYDALGAAYDHVGLPSPARDTPALRVVKDGTEAG